MRTNDPDDPARRELFGIGRFVMCCLFVPVIGVALVSTLFCADWWVVKCAVWVFFIQGHLF